MIQIREAELTTASRAYTRFQWLDNSHILLLTKQKYAGDNNKYVHNGLTVIDVKNMNWYNEISFSSDNIVNEFTISPNGKKILYYCTIESAALSLFNNAFDNKDNTTKFQTKKKKRIHTLFLKPLNDGNCKIVKEEDDDMYYNNLRWVTNEIFVYQRSTFAEFDSSLSSNKFPLLKTSNLIMQNLSDDTSLINGDNIIAVSVKNDSLFVWLQSDKVINTDNHNLPIIIKKINSTIFEPEVQYTQCKPLPQYEDQIFYYFNSLSDSLIFLNFNSGQRTSLWLRYNNRDYEDFAISPNDSLIAFLIAEHVVTGLSVMNILKVEILQLNHRIYDVIDIILHREM